MMNTRSLGVALVFVAGCAVGGASARFVVPPASAQQAATLTKWEYLSVYENHHEAFKPKAQEAGAEGWELVASMVPGHYFFKRPKL